MSIWQGRVAFITGGVSGLGLGIAKACSDAGMRLALSYRNEAYRAEAAEWFAANGREEPLWVRLDVLDRAGWAAAADAVGDRRFAQLLQSIQTDEARHAHGQRNLCTALAFLQHPSGS